MGTGLFTSVTAVLLLYYMTDTLGIAAALAGAVLFVPKAWDVVFDPLVGIASDRTRSRWGRRQPWLVAGALLSALAFWALFTTPGFSSPGPRAAWVGVAFFIGMSGYALFAVPYAAMPAEMSDDTNERTAIMSFRMGFVLVGTLAGAVAAPMLVRAGGGSSAGHAAMAGPMAALIAAAMLATALGARRLPLRDAPAAAAHAPLRQLLGNHAYRRLLAAYMLVLVGNGTMAAAAPYFVVHVLHQPPEAVAAIFASLLLAAVAAMPAWVAVAARWGKRVPALAAMALFGLALAAVAGLGGDAGAPLRLALCALAGMGFAGSQLLPFSILTDVIEADRQASGQPREGSFTGLFIADEKAALALGPLITGVLLDAGGFVANAGGGAQPPGAATGIAWAFGGLPGLLALAGAAVLARAVQPPR